MCNISDRTMSSSWDMGRRKVSGGAVESLKDEREKSDIAPDFECNICFELAKEPVVTCCGHLFCWPCLYQWLHVHCDYRECPVCKGKVDESSIVPIYGRGSCKEKKTEEDGDEALKVPPRPQGNRVESTRQQLQSRTLQRSGASIEEHFLLFNEAQPRLQSVTVEGRSVYGLARNTSPNSQISASNSLLPDGAVSQQRFNIDGSLSRISAILSEFRSLTRRSDEAGGVPPTDDDRRDFEPVHSQTSNSSTMAMMQGMNAAAIDAPEVANMGVSSMLLRGRRRRRRSTTAGALQGNTSAADDASDRPNRRGSSIAPRARGRSTTNVTQETTTTDASADPNRGGFSMVLRRRTRRRITDSSDMGHER